MISSDTPNAISSPESAAGPTQLGLLDGQMIDRSGVDLVPASHSVSQVGGRGSKTSGIYGQTSIVSSVAPGPLSSWENRLRERLATLGSTEFSLTWRRKPTPGGRSISRLAASIRRRSEIGFIGWPAPTANMYDADVEVTEARRQRLKAKHTNGNGFGLTLSQAAKIAGWTAPQAHDTGKPDAKRWRRYGTEHGGANLNDEAAMVELAGWAAPVVPNGGRMPKDYQSMTDEQLRRLARILTLTNAVQTAEERKELDTVQVEISRRKEDS